MVPPSLLAVYLGDGKVLAHPRGQPSHVMDLGAPRERRIASVWRMPRRG